MGVEETPLDVGTWYGAVIPPLWCTGGSVSTPLEVACASPAWSWGAAEAGSFH